MDVYQCIRDRVAVKGFKPDPIPDWVINKILMAARWAPSQRNRQPWHLILIRDKGTLRELASLTSSGPYIAEAPLAIAVAIEGSRMPQFEAGRLIENMVLVAWSEGIGTSMVGGWDRDKVKELLNLPEEMEFITAMPYGYPTDEATSGGKRRKPLSEIIHEERFGESWVG